MFDQTPTYTVALVAVQMIAGVTVAAVTSLTVLTRVFTAAVIHRTLVLIYSPHTRIRAWSRDLAGVPVK